MSRLVGFRAAASTPERPAVARLFDGDRLLVRLDASEVGVTWAPERDRPVLLANPPTVEVEDGDASAAWVDDEGRDRLTIASRG